MVLPWLVGVVELWRVVVPKVLRLIVHDHLEHVLLHHHIDSVLIAQDLVFEGAVLLRELVHLLEYLNVLGTAPVSKLVKVLGVGSCVCYNFVGKWRIAVPVSRFCAIGGLFEEEFAVAG